MSLDLAPTPYDVLVDERFGPIRKVIEFPLPPRFPRPLVTRGADVAHSLAPTRWHADRAAVGAAFDDESAARQAAIGEAVERYCGNFVPSGLRRASYDELRRAGLPALDPHELVLFSPRQYAAAGFPFVPFTRDLRVQWVPGHDLATGAETLLPASWVYCNYHFGERIGVEPPTHGVIYAGVAAGPSRDFAERSAIEELIERDATAIWWHSGAPAVGLDVTDSTLLRRAMVSVEDIVEYHFFRIPSLFNSPVIGCLMHDRELDVVGAGFACRTDATAAALKALSEAIGTWFYSTGLLDPNGAVWSAIDAGALDARAYKPHRADRRYLDDFRADFRDVIDLGSQLQVYLDPRMLSHTRRMTDIPERIAIGEVPGAPSAGSHDRGHYLDELSRRGLRAYSVDLTTSDVRPSGLRVVRVLVPGLYPNAPAALPHLGGTRLYTEPEALGLLEEPLTEDRVDLTPIPHA
ncbi:YcaO-like family protein [Micromonospora craniellae]|uniref:YcaO domain-containing protein n=1 Tax=Micromonospora craniellae TaxID=2294034 RepID=A0A372FZD2_9ACTN|nr:YcaO-like family protein [Micromonospora craniellae]QOC93439.1 YcaO-like family protein [Micromonospora craniellae]RFS45886.1 hypothetical protein D0Q02_14885 [Micromonospora craniellae]